jgi:2-succinyl-5-enolpyruvyl-6-hydroxy-3-cyclohexene-1-carboxylate synthase
MSHPNPSTALARVVVDELAARGVELVVISPGSRSAALAIAATEHPQLATRVFIDERSAAFHALGAARASQRPAAVVSTSGTAVANLLPAVVEADMSCVPLVVVSADRPAELRGVGANQTIDQVGLFGSKVRAFVDIPAPGPANDANTAWRGLVADSIVAATGPTPGPVHLNVGFREPTVPVSDDGRTTSIPYRFATPRVTRDVAMAPANRPLPVPRLEPRQGLVIAGDGEYSRDALADRAAELGWPVLATAMSGMRGGRVITTYHHLLGDGVPPELVPETVVAVGAIGPSPRLEDLVATARTRLRVDRWGRTIDPRRNASHLVAGDVIELLGRVDGEAPPEWEAAWMDAEGDRRAELDAHLGSLEQMSGPGIAAVLNVVDWNALVVASSLPIRDVDAHLRRSGAIYANRGASGIDGFVSTALGVASVQPRTLAFTGDLSLLHDSNGFLHDGEIDLTIVVMDNEGGGLFDSLPQAVHAPDYERLFVTPPLRDLAALAGFHHLRHHRADDLVALRGLADAALARNGIDLVVARVERSYDLGARAQLDR